MEGSGTFEPHSLHLIILFKDQTGIKKEIDHRVGPLKVDTKAWQQALTLSRLQVSQNDQESPKMFKYEAPLNSIISQASEKYVE